MYVRKKNEMAVSPVIAVILMVAITVVLAGVLYLWVMGIATPPPGESTKMMMTVSDSTTSANYKPGGSPTAFESGEPILKLKQTAGKNVDWQIYKLKLENVGTEEQYDCAVLSINGVPYSPGNKSNPGDIVLVHCPDTVSHYHAGDYVLLSIVSGESIVWTMGEPVQIN